MQSTIKNDQLTAAINHHGAELCSLKNSNGVEFIWQADKAIWGRHAPVLFPIVGRLKNDSYTYMGKSYSLPQHGFARDKNFEVIEKATDRISFSLKADKETIIKYPFQFELRITNALTENELMISYEVINHDKTEMPFSIGAHPGFICPVDKDEKPEDYIIIFSENEKLETALLQNGLFSGEKKLLSENSNIIQITNKTFANDALVFENLKSDFVSLQSTRTKHAVKMSISGFPYLGIWSKPGAAFVCLEPWYGKADDINHDGNILLKEGIIILKSGQTFCCTFNIKVN